MDSFFFQSRLATEDDYESNNEEEEEDDVKPVCGEKRKILFIHQTEWQRQLIARYGNDMVLLDATYRTTQYALPLFFIAVKTNFDYQIVGSFVTEDETKESIIEALSILKEWNPKWRPSHFMTDFCEEEIQAAESVFEGTLNLEVRFLPLLLQPETSPGYLYKPDQDI